MATAKKIEHRTERFIAAYNKMSEENKLPTNTELARIIGIKSKSTISEIIAKRQNIQPDSWEKFKNHFKIRDSENGSENSVSRNTVSDRNGQTDLIPVLVGLMEQQKLLMEKQNSILEAQNSLVTEKFSSVESNLNAVIENQQVGDARQRRSLEVLFGLHLGVQPEKTVQELINVVDTGAVDSFVPKKKKGIRSGAGK